VTPEQLALVRETALLVDAAGNSSSASATTSSRSTPARQLFPDDTTTHRGDLTDVSPRSDRSEEPVFSVQPVTLD
jgi:hypothetical protein